MTHPRYAIAYKAGSFRNQLTWKCLSSFSARLVGELFRDIARQWPDYANITSITLNTESTEVITQTTA